MTTPTVYIIRNQAGLFLSKQLEWIPSGETQTLYRCAHRDEAVNTVFEVSSKDVYLRAEAIACGVDAKGQPVIPPHSGSDASPVVLLDIDALPDAEMTATADAETDRIADEQPFTAPCVQATAQES